MRAELDGLSRICGEWLTRKTLRARTVTLKVRYDDFTTVTRSLSVPGGVHATTDVSAQAQLLLDRTDAAGRPVRLLGVSVHNFVDTSTPWVGDDGHLPFDEGDHSIDALTTGAVARPRIVDGGAHRAPGRNTDRRWRRSTSRMCSNFTGSG